MLAPCALPSASPSDGWGAELRVRLGLRHGRTRLLDASHRGPLRVQRAFHPEPDGAAHLVILHPPAGLVGGDHLDVRARVDDGARALLTTTGAGKAYRSLGATSVVDTHLDVGAGADLEHVPQETVIFDGARAALTTRIALAPGARLLAWEVVCLGRPACGERFERGGLRLRLEVEREGRLRFVERGRVEAGAAALDAPWGMAGFAAFGTLVSTEGSVDSLRDALADVPITEARVGVTRVGELSVVRVLGRDGAHARSLLERARHRVRDAWSRPRVDPAIWRS
ncbi:MAG: urease accessory protein UreD [Sandaracinaceae bacterium]|nr:urease accessory protein UreD [Sandaracinaceae bacterium]